MVIIMSIPMSIVEREVNMNTFVTGGNGMLGSHISYGLKPTVNEVNLLNFNETLKFIKENDVTTVIHCAAKVGGLKYNMDHNSDMLLENLEMNNNLLRASIECGVKKILSVLSTCVFPATAQEPFGEDDIHNGFRHPTNFGYAYSKRTLLVASEAIRQQHGINCMNIIPSNMFGAGDNFNLNECHVIPALIRKAYESKNGKLLVGGTGVARIEFLYAKDAARVMEWMVDNIDTSVPVIVSPDDDISILEISKLIASRFDLEIEFDETIPDGQITRRSNNSHFKSYSDQCDVNLTNFEDALSETIDWFVKNYKNARL